MQEAIRLKVLDAVSAVYREIFGKELEENELSLPVEEIGLDSLDIIDFVYKIEDKLNLRLNFEDSKLAKISMNELISQLGLVLEAKS